MSNNNSILTSIPNIALKRAAVESTINGLLPVDTIADRIILLLNGDVDKLDMLITGIPIDFLNAEERLKAESAAMSLIPRDDVVQIRKMEFMPEQSIKVIFTYRDTRFIKPGDTESREKLERGEYCSESKWCKDEIFSEEVVYQKDATESISVSKFIQKGIRFECV